MNRVTVIIEADHDDCQHRTEVSAVFPDPHFTSEQVLHVFSDALRGSGYACPIEGLTIEKDEPCA
jgi:hypothetical protein